MKKPLQFICKGCNIILERGLPLLEGRSVQNNLVLDRLTSQVRRSIFIISYADGIR